MAEPSEPTAPPAGQAKPPSPLTPGALAVLVLICAGLLYGTSYQQFRHFDLRETRGFADAENYVRMSHGDYAVDPVHAYRPVVPWLASMVRGLIPARADRADDRGVRDKLAFYAVNFVFGVAAAVLLFAILRQLRFDSALSLFGVAIFLSSRAIVSSVGTPLVDSYYFAGVAAIVWLSLRPTRLALALVLPLVILSKEAIYPLALLPLFRREGRSALYAASIAVSIALVFCVRQEIHTRLLAAGAEGAFGEATDLTGVVERHIGYFSYYARGTLSAHGMHDLLNSFTVFAFFGALGWWGDRRREAPRVPAHLGWLVPLTLVYAMLSGTRGRQLFASFPVVIPYALLFLQDAKRRILA